jgi:hypothetical protein
MQPSSSGHLLAWLFRRGWRDMGPTPIPPWFFGILNLFDFHVWAEGPVVFVYFPDSPAELTELSF